MFDSINAHAPDRFSSLYNVRGESTLPRQTDSESKFLILMLINPLITLLLRIFLLN